MKDLANKIYFWGDKLQDFFLLFVRLYWGYHFYLAGHIKFENLPRTTHLFSDLHFPLPKLFVYLAGGIELIGGICLLVGLASRLVSIPLMITMLVAYITAHSAVFFGIFNDPAHFFSADPYLYLQAAVIVWLFGPGKYSLDHFLKIIRSS